jgi:4-carboxymuconolactone decarboxylase
VTKTHRLKPATSAPSTWPRQLTETSHLSDDLYSSVRAILGDTGTVELVTLCGYYTLISFLLNAFEVPLPPGATHTWPHG